MFIKYMGFFLGFSTVAMLLDMCAQRTFNEISILYLRAIPASSQYHVLHGPDTHSSLLPATCTICLPHITYSLSLSLSLSPPLSLPPSLPLTLSPSLALTLRLSPLFFSLNPRQPLGTRLDQCIGEL